MNKWMSGSNLFWPVYLCQEHNCFYVCVENSYFNHFIFIKNIDFWMRVDAFLVVRTNSYVVSPGSYDGAHMGGNYRNNPPKKVKRIECVKF